MDSMLRWLKNYEASRVGRERRRVRNDDSEYVGWSSTRYDLESRDWDTVKSTYIEPLEMTFGQACSALKRSWHNLKFSKRDGYGDNQELQYRINRLQFFMGLPLSEWSEGPSVEWVTHQLTLEEQSGDQETSAEELALKYEEESERQEQQGWGVEETPDEEIENEDPLYKILRQEERQAALEDAGIVSDSDSSEQEHDVWDEEW